jgi:16S rRNA (cytosine1402-N4)-methyltransferase
MMSSKRWLGDDTRYAVDYTLFEGRPHRPVMPEEILRMLAPSAGDVVIDATAGAGGHSVLLAKAITPGGTLIALDRDPEACKRAEAFLKEHAPSDVAWKVVNANAADLTAVIERLGLKDGINLFLMDCGVASFHFDQAGRGFSMKHDGPLDMRLSPSNDAPTAADLVNEADAGLLKQILRVYGEEQQTNRIVRAIEKVRANGRIETTHQLAEIIREAYPAKLRGGRRDVATKTFQALRIYVNRELESLRDTLRQMLSLLKIGGRAAILSFHSLEDRLVKQTFAAACEKFYKTEDDYLKGNSWSAYRIAKRMKPSAEECDTNRRSRSAILRVIEKLAELPREIEWPEPRLVKGAWQ